MTVSILFVMLIVIVIGLVRAAIIVPKDKAYVLERLGAFSRVLGPGLHVLIPFLDRVVLKVPLTDNITSLPSLVCQSKDQATVTVEGKLVYRVVDGEKLYKNLADYENALPQLAQTAFKQVVGDLTIAELLDGRRSVEATSLSYIKQRAHGWGIEVSAVMIDTLKPAR